MNYLITLTEDFGDSTEKSSVVVDSISPITIKDVSLLNYILSTDISDPDKDVEIELISDIVQSFSHNMDAQLLIIEKINGKFSIHEKSISINDLSNESIRNLLLNPVDLNGDYLTFSSVKNDANNNTFVIDKRLKPHQQSPLNEAVTFLFDNMGLNTTYTFSSSFHINSCGQRCVSHIYYFPSQSKIVEHLSTCSDGSPRMFDSHFTNDVTIMDLKGNIEHSSCFESKAQ